jgi:uncharacterized protein YoaH (UPF0181 family)
MALGSKNRDYKTGDRAIINNLKKHAARMDELMAEGMSTEAASDQAYQELRAGKLATVKLTAKEQMVLGAIAENEFQDCPGQEEAIGNPVWADCIYCEIEGKSLSGVIASLVKKGLVDTSGLDGKYEATLWITAAGFKAYKEGK